MPRPAFADPQAAALPLRALAPDALPATLAALPPAQAAFLAASGFEAALGEVRLLPGEGGVAGAVLGLGDAAARRRTRFGPAKAAGLLPPGDWRLEGVDDPALRDETALGWLLAQYRFDSYRAPRDRPLARLVCPGGCDAVRLTAMAEAEWLTRDLINTPANDMGPDELEAAFRALAGGFGASVRAIAGDELEQGFPMVAAVGRASPRAPRILEMRWGGAGPALTLAGKGVCFDTGGLDLKPSANMLLMKKDMGGAATVMGLAQMVMALGLPLRLRVIVPAVENAVSGSAMRPRDILRSRKGLTVEVNNTDAEGRLILADALAWGAEEGPDLMLSMATLTGAARVAVGPDLAPFFTDDEGLAGALQAAAGPAFDPVWRLPLWDPYETLIEPGIADLDNAPSGGFAGATTAALFLRRFAGGGRWAHFDIFGHVPADLPGRPKGGAGQGARAVLGALPEVLGL